MSEQENLFNNFSGTNLKEWEEKIITDLKGKPLETVIATNWEDILIQPHYAKEHLATYTNSSTSQSNNWSIGQEIDCSNATKANKEALYALKNGANSLVFNHVNPAQLNELLTDIMIEIIEVHFKSEAPNNVAKELKAYCKANAIDFIELTGSILPQSSTFSITETLKETLPLLEGSQLACIPVDVNNFAYFGANSTQQIGLSLALLNETIGALINDFSIDEIANHLIIHHTTGHDYFVEIAKIRALKATIASVLNTYGVTDEQPINIVTSIGTLFWQETDAENNLLRGSSACMAAAIAGSNTIITPSFKLTDEAQGKRLSNNIQLLLKEESSIDKVIDVANGSYYIEYLTHELTKNSWSLFQETENQSGYLACIANNYIQSIINVKANELIALIDSKKLKIVGTTIFTENEKQLTISETKNTQGFCKLVWK